MQNLIRIIAVSFVCLAAPIRAENVAEFIFDESLLTELQANSVLSYGHSLAAPESGPKKPFDDGEITMRYEAADDGSGQVLVAFARLEKKQAMNPLPTVGGNPLVMIFLENTARAMAAIAGGSPFYIRNRIKSALLAPGEEVAETILVDGAEIEATTVTLEPFLNDPNRPRMGDFADLKISFTYSRDIPGGIHMLKANTPLNDKNEMYQEEIVFVGLRAAE